MQLMPCGVCGAPVSIEANACPQCGQPTLVGKQAQGQPIAIVLVVIGALVTVGAFYNMCAH